MMHKEPKAFMQCEGKRQTEVCKRSIEFTEKVKIIDVEIPRGTVKPGVTNLLELSPA